MSQKDGPLWELNPWPPARMLLTAQSRNHTTRPSGRAKNTLLNIYNLFLSNCHFILSLSGHPLMYSHCRRFYCTSNRAEWKRSKPNDTANVLDSTSWVNKQCHCKKRSIIASLTDNQNFTLAFIYYCPTRHMYSPQTKTKTRASPNKKIVFRAYDGAFDGAPLSKLGTPCM